MKTIKEIKKKAKKEESCIHFKKLFNLMVDPVVVVDSKGRFLEVSNRAEIMTGFKKEELLGKNFLKTKVVTKKSKKILLENLLKRMFGKRPKPYEIECLTKDGKKIPLEVNARKIDYMGKPADLVIFRNIAERKKTQERIQLLSNAMETSINAIAINNLDGRFIYANSALEKMWGYSFKELTKMTIPQFVPKEALGKLIKEILPAIKKKGGWICENWGQRKDGTKFPISMSTSLIKDGKGKPIAILGSFIDITHREETEEVIKRLKEIDKLKDEFLNISTHELRTPLTAIVGLSEIIKGEKVALTPKGQKYISIIHDEAIKLNHIVKKILTATRYESGKETVYNESFNLASFILSLIPNLNLIAEKTRSRIITNIEKKSISMTSDKEKISQVIYNLVDNAVKYGMEGQAIIVSIIKSKKDQAKIAVTDQGKGIPKILQKRLFTKFSQLEPSFSRTQEGTGLGLYICKLIVDKLGGKIGVSSELGKGSTFYFTLPLHSKKEI